MKCVANRMPELTIYAPFIQAAEEIIVNRLIRLQNFCKLHA